MENGALERLINDSYGAIIIPIGDQPILVTNISISIINPQTSFTGKMLNAKR
jgi:hypothetical protein